MRIILFILIVSLLFSCSEGTVEIQNLDDKLDKFIYKSELICDNSGNPINGKVYSVYESGSLKSKVRITNGIPTGVFTTYFENGSVKNTKEFYKGKLCCKEESFFENGKLEGFANYNQNGFLDGEFMSYFENGLMKSRGYFKNGKQHSVWEDFHENGVLRKKELFVDGKNVGEVEHFDLNGNKTNLVEMLNDKINSMRN